ncbi:cholecystokinin receptor-like [Astyanax mexicanus]|uniref:cholecystokinin receptor-like n=1 Tax=Astyanax mexicanus TaxID=7994 RepID=UPI0020CB032B|nr:cholecystokinin receptor-like [Astyanax mexicanus]
MYRELEMDLLRLNESQSGSAVWEINNATAENSTSAAELNSTCSSGSSSGSGSCTISPKLQPARHKEVDSLRILLYSLIFLISVFGNLLIIVVLIVNKRMRTVTNSFLLSLAVSDLMMAVFCMPFTLIPNLLEDFIFGAVMCKTVTYFMGISVSISTFSLVAIAIERYSAICNPLTSRAWQTRSHAYKVIAGTWVLSVAIMIPYPVFSTLVSFNKPNNTTANMCRLDWPVSQVEQIWYVLLLLILFFIPGGVMSIAYGLISRELYRGIQFELEQKKDSSALSNGMNGTISHGHDDGDGCYIQVPKKTPAMELSTLSTSAPSKTDRPRSNTSEAKLLAKKRVIRMLIIIVVMFFVCWMPLYAANTWKAFDQLSAKRALSGAPISFIQLLSYTSACVNPIIYCFMNKRFRKALLATFACCSVACRRRRRRDGDEEATGVTAASMSKFSYTTVSTMGPC